jgi:hypothetical protein
LAANLMPSSAASLTASGARAEFPVGGTASVWAMADVAYTQLHKIAGSEFAIDSAFQHLPAAHSDTP